MASFIRHAEIPIRLWNTLARVGHSLADSTPNSARRKLVVAPLALSPHSNIATSRCRHFSDTPRNGRRQSRSPVRSPSGVLPWTSPIPSPSSARAHSRSAWQAVTCPRRVDGRRPYPRHSSVETIAPGSMALLATLRKVSPSESVATVGRT